MVEVRFDREEPKIEHVRPKDLKIDLSVQRDFTVRRGDAIAGDFNIHSIGVVTVSRREGGTLVLLDGQHRVQAAILCGFGDYPIWAEIHEGLTLAEEAQLFRQKNNTKAVPVIDKHRVAVAEGDPTACGVDDILKEFKLSLAKGTINGFGAIAVAHKLYGMHPEMLRQSIRLSRLAWDVQPYALSGPILEAIALVLQRYRNVLDAKVFAAKLAKYPGGPSALVGAARGLARMYTNRWSTAYCCAELMVNLYNKNMSANAIEPWR